MSTILVRPNYVKARLMYQGVYEQLWDDYDKIYDGSMNLTVSSTILLFLMKWNLKIFCDLVRF